jgi:hypothetical protein
MYIRLDFKVNRPQFLAGPVPGRPRPEAGFKGLKPGRQRQGGWLKLFFRGSESSAAVKALVQPAYSGRLFWERISFGAPSFRSSGSGGLRS